MNIGVVKIGGRILPSNNTSINTGEGESIVKLLSNSNVLNVFAKYNDKIINQSTEKVFYINNREDSFNINDYNLDCLVVVNGSPNFFGGNVEQTLIDTYRDIKNFNGKILYFLLDPLLYPKQIKSHVLRLLSKEEIASEEVSRIADSVDISNKEIICISQARNTKALETKIEKEKLNVEFRYFPFDQYPLVNYDKNQYFFNLDPEVDLLYGGTFRSGRREKDLIKYYFGLPADISVELFGKLPIDKFNQKKIEGLSVPASTGEIPFYEFCDKMNKARASVIIGDSFYRDGENMSPRLWENIISRCVSIIDKNFDTKMYYKDIVTEECYVGNRQELESLLYKLKDDNYRRSLIDKQIRSILDWNVENYVSTLMITMK